MISKFTLDNGIRVVSESIPHAHSVSIGIWVSNGSRHERRESGGIAHLIEHMLFKGTQRRSSLDISREIDSVGGVLNAFTSREYVCYYAKVLHKFLPQALDLLADIFLNAVIADEDLEKERNVILQELGMLEDTPDDVIHDLFCRNFWMDHPMGRSILGTEESVSSITREAALAFKRDSYRGENIIISVAGKIDQVDLQKLIPPYFRDVPGGSAEKCLPVTGYRRASELLERELEQVHLCFGMPALPQAHPQRFAGFLLNTILGGGMSSRLFQEIREKQGLAYSVYSYLSAYSDTASMVIYAGTGEERVMEVLDIIFRELR
ncbi:MAG TPA: pitrilysin family protein, partial [Verrucomicrobiae bacterium]|nr:pitrilysin family protein [Verrucomicrobiae bacterium]